MEKIKCDMWKALIKLDCEGAVNAFLNYHGAQLLDEGFHQFLVEETIITEEYEA